MDDTATKERDFTSAWSECRFLTCSVLPVRRACNCHCSFCFSRSSISALQEEKTNLLQLDVEAYYRWARERGATRLVITGGGEPLLRPAEVLRLIEIGSRFFGEITCFTNGALLTQSLARSLKDTGLSYLCYSRHHDDNDRCRELMGKEAPLLDDFFRAAESLRIRATCVMAKGYVDSTAAVWKYIEALQKYGVREFTFKHTYVAYTDSLFQGSEENRWAKEHQVEFDPFHGMGEVIATLPWGPEVRRISDLQICYYQEPTPEWERRNRLCRSSNLMSDGNVYASLEDQQSLLHRLNPLK